MKKSIMLCAAGAALFLSSCDSNEPACKITSYEEGSYKIAYTYGEDGLIAGLTTFSNGNEQYQVTIVRNGDNNVTTFNVSENGVLRNKQTMEYEGANLVKMTLFNDEDQDGQVDDMMIESTFDYQGGKLFDRTDTDGNTISYTTYEWTGNNITKETIGDEHLEYAYDLNTNPRKTNGFESMFLAFTYTQTALAFSANNPVEIRSFSEDVQNGIQEYSYTYNENGFPLTATIAGDPDEVTYTYDCE